MDLSCNRNISTGYPQTQVHSSMSLSLSNVTGDNNTLDYQDCGLSSPFLTSESQWELNLEATCPEARDKAKMRYREKRKTRKYVHFTFCLHISLYNYYEVSIVYELIH